MKAFFRLSLSLCLLYPLPGICSGNETTEDKANSDSSSLIKILKAEAEGQPIDRSIALKPPSADSKAREKATELKDKTVRWQAGEIEINNRWQKLSELEQNQPSKEMQRYLAERGDNPLDEEGHRRLAKWCLGNNLPEQAKAHWFGVLEADFSDAEARQALRFTQIDGRWFSEQEVASTNENALENVKALRSWLPKIRDIVAGIESNDTSKRLKSIQQLKALKDPKAVKALQFAAERSDAQTALHLLNAIKRFRTKDACMALASIAVATPSSELGQEAASALARFPKEMYVPALLDFMSTERDLRRNLVTEPNGDLVLQLLEVREMKSHVETAQLDKVLKINNANAALSEANLNFASRAPVTTDNETLIAASENVVANAVTRNEALRDAEAQQARLNRENEATRQLQRNVCTVLRSATGEKLDDSPKQWWNWWDLEQEILSVGNKEILKNYNRNFQSLVYSVDPERVRVFQVTGSRENEAIPEEPVVGAGTAPNFIRPGFANINPGARYDCLIAGTLIQTETGMRPIESIRIGDNVVSQNIKTGEIALKPVLRTAQRPPSITCKIVLVSDEKIQTTLGHHWWVVGSGWTKTKDLETGMHIRTASGSAEIAKLEDAEEAVTYNISVADHHSFFVGRERLLSFDSRELTPTFQVVPGLAPSPLFKD